MGKSLKSLTFFGSILALYISIIFYPLLFGLITFLASLIIFGRIERDRNTHDISFYITGDLSKSQKRYIYYYNIAEIFLRSAALGILSVFLFSGTDSNRILLLAIIFIICVIVGYFFLRSIKNNTNINPARWAYAKASIVLGLFFSLTTSKISGQSFTEITAQSLKNKWWGNLNFNQIAELIYGMLHLFNNFITAMFVKFFGFIIGNFFGFVISTNIIHGFVIALYSLLLLEFSNKQNPIK